MLLDTFHIIPFHDALIISDKQASFIILDAPSTNLPSCHDPPSPNQIIRVPRKQRLPIRAPRQTHTLRLPALLAHGRIIRLQLINFTLLLQIEDDDARGSGGAQPVSVGREDEGVDLVAGGEGVEVFGFVEVPEHGGAIFAAGSAQGAVGGDGDGVDVAGVADVVGLDAAGGEFPDLLGFSRKVSIAGRVEVHVLPQAAVRVHQCVGDGLSHCSKNSEVANTFDNRKTSYKSSMHSPSQLIHVP